MQFIYEKLQWGKLTLVGFRNILVPTAYNARQELLRSELQARSISIWPDYRIKSRKSFSNLLPRLLLLFQMANPAPPLGSQLGQVGINIASFVKDFNLRTSVYKVSVRRIIDTMSNRLKSTRLQSIRLLVKSSTELVFSIDLPKPNLTWPWYPELGSLCPNQGASPQDPPNQGIWSYVIYVLTRGASPLDPPSL